MRIAKIKDLDEIMLIINDGKTSLRKDGIDQWQNGLPDRKGILENILTGESFVYEENGEIKGFIGADGPYIAGIFVDFRSRSMGIGKQLLDYVKLRKSTLTLQVYEKNERAVSFYRREGFIVREKLVDEETGETEFQMDYTGEQTAWDITR